MSTSEIFRVARQAFTIAGVLLILLMIVFVILYFGIYKKIMHGKKNISFQHLILYMIGITYVVGVFCVTLKNRMSGLDGGISLKLFSSYRFAWNSYRENAWRDIILNIIMFLPLGVLLPMLYTRCQKFWMILMIGFSSSLVIEFTQFLTKRGIFEVDDLWGNTSGAIIGYGLVMLFLNYRSHRDKRKRILGTGQLILIQIPLISYTLFFVFAGILHNMHALGKLSVQYKERKNMEQVTVECNIELDEQEREAKVYQVVKGEQNDALQIAERIMQYIGTDVDEGRIEIHKEDACYESVDGSCEVTVDFMGLASRCVYKENASHERKAGYDKETVREALGRLGYDVGENLTFQETEPGEYCFFAELQEGKGQVYDGWLSCEMDEEGQVIEVDDQILECHEVLQCEIICEMEAYYGKIKRGYFKLDDFSGKGTMQVMGVLLDYLMDSKGYLQPVYFFDVQADGEEKQICIPAIV